MISSQSLHSLNNNCEGKSLNLCSSHYFCLDEVLEYHPTKYLHYGGGEVATLCSRMLATSFEHLVRHLTNPRNADAPKDPRTQSPSTKIPPPFISIPHGGGGPCHGTEGKCCTNTLLDITFFNYLRGDPPRLILYVLYSYLFVASIFYRFL